MPLYKSTVYVGNDAYHVISFAHVKYKRNEVADLDFKLWDNKDRYEISPDMSNVSDTELKFNVLIRVKANLQCYELDACGTLADCASCSILSVLIIKRRILIIKQYMWNKTYQVRLHTLP